MKRLVLLVVAAVALTATTSQAQQRMTSGVQLAAQPSASVAFAPSRATADVRAVAAPAVPAPANAPAASGFAKSGFAQFMASPAGRVLRVVAGAGMIAGGISMDSNGGNALAIVGAVPLTAGLFDICWLSPIFGGPLKGKDIRAAK